MENIESKVIQTEDENGDIHNFELIDIVEVDNREYGILLYLDEEDSDEEEQELAVMRLLKDGEGYIFETVESEEEFEKVAAFVEAELNADLSEDE